MSFSLHQMMAQVRERLSDSDDNCRHWSDDRLLHLLNEGVLEIALVSDLFVSKGWAPVKKGQPFYDLSDRVLKLDRIVYKETRKYTEKDCPDVVLTTYNERPLRIMTQDQLDTACIGGVTVDGFDTFPSYFKAGWENVKTVNSFQAVITAKKQPGNFRIYPIPNHEEDQVIKLLEDDETLQGIKESGEFTANQQLNERFSDAGNPLPDNFGDIGAELPKRWLQIHYYPQPVRIYHIPENTGIRKHTDGTPYYSIGGVGDGYPIDDYPWNKQYRKAIENYIVAHALRDNTQIYDPNRAEREYGYYMKSLDDLKAERGVNFSNGSPSMDYRPYGA